MAPTKHRILRMNDAHWGQLANMFRLVVPPERLPAHANPESDWQISEGLRMIADGTITLTIRKTPNK